MKRAIIGAGMSAGPSEPPGRKKLATRFFWPQESIVRANASGGGCGGLAGRRSPAHRHSPFIALTTR